MFSAIANKKFTILDAFKLFAKLLLLKLDMAKILLSGKMIVIPRDYLAQMKNKQ